MAELARRRIPATIFVAPGLLEDRTFWWDAVPIDDRGILHGIRNFALEELRGQDMAVREWASRAGIGMIPAPDYARTCTEEELRTALRHPGITLGSHTWSHPNLARASATELASELGRSLNWLSERFDRVIPWLAYPYGLSSPLVERVAAEVGYGAGLRVDGGVLRRPITNSFALPRINVPAGLSADGLVLRATGLIRA